jgi:hypothetical protein
MCGDTVPSYWRKVLVHESGHAVAALAIFDKAGDIFVKPASDSEEPYSASHRFAVDLMKIYSGEIDPVNAIIVMAAGARAEAVGLGIVESTGFKGDLAKIKRLRQSWERNSNEEYWRTFDWPAEAINAKLAQIPQYQSKLAEIVAEMDVAFPRTTSLIRNHLDAIEMIAAEAQERLDAVGKENLTENLVLLKAARVREIWEATRTS